MFLIKCKQLFSSLTLKVLLCCFLTLSFTVNANAQANFAGFPGYTLVNYIDNIITIPPGFSMLSYITDNQINTGLFNMGTNSAGGEMPGATLFMTWNNPISNGPGNDILIACANDILSGTATIRLQLADNSFTPTQLVDFTTGMISSTLGLVNVILEEPGGTGTTYGYLPMAKVIDISDFYTGTLDVKGIEFTNFTYANLDLLAIAGTQNCTPTLTITSPANNICAGSSITFTATPTNGGGSPVYQWTVNGIIVGTNSSTYTTASLMNGDVVSCVLTSSSSCSSVNTAVSNNVTMSVNTSVTPALTIGASANNVCVGTNVTFTATAVNGGVSPSYQWQVNGVNTGTNSSTFSSSSLANTDIVSCILTSSSSCALPVNATSNNITMQVNANVTPTINIAGSANNICSGSAVTFTANESNGGTSPSYQWKVNGINTGTNNATFTSSTLLNADIVSCELTSNNSCASITNANSNSITMIVNPVIIPSITITSSANSICPGTTVDFIATTVNQGSAPFYQWKINGINAGTNSSSYNSSTLLNGEIVSCILTSNATCTSAANVVSNNITFIVKPIIIPSINITASYNTICTGDIVTFNASAINPGNNAIYQWMVNGINVGMNNSSYQDNHWNNNDQVICVLTPGIENCTTTDIVSNTQTITIHPLPVVNIIPSDTTVSPGAQVHLQFQSTGLLNSYSWLPLTGLIDPAMQSPTTIPLAASTDYQLNYRTGDGCRLSKKIKIKVIRKLIMPNSFTPNNDGLNDVFRIPPGVSMTLNDFSVFDRYGNRIFQTNNVNNGWDGTIKGIKSEAGSYVYVITGKDLKGKLFLKGTVLLVR